MAPSKMEECVGSVKEQMVSLLIVQSDIQKLSSLESVVGTLMSKLFLFDRFELALQQLDTLYRVSDHRPSASNPGPRTPTPVSAPPSAVMDRTEGCLDTIRSNLRPRRLEMPVFDGLNPNGYVFCAERFFR
ncbi:hypothetical protein PanWU01x14_227910 [Parasponia andersonii]|uniref:Uncharacterized protein n=1 Tax=Parasponia andersonii TaxID=3476 RepID=A0A2P5BLS2_PARAD|nr:hypothetical protein PanWU01x14_227910 [Parasponia andersonii]